MSNHNHTGSIWGNATDGVNRHSEPNKQSATIGNPLPAGQSLIVLCYTLGETVSFQNPENPPGQPFSSNAWDYVVTSDQDKGGYVADVYVDTKGDIRQQLGTQGTCDALSQQLGHSSGSHSPLG